MMKKVKFPELDIHQQIHNDFLAKIKTLRAPLDNTTVTWAKKWWVSLLALLEKSIYLHD